MSLGSDTQLLKKYQQVLGEAQMGLWEWDFSADQIFFDEGMRRLYGLPMDKTHLSTKESITFVHPEDHSVIETLFKKIKTNEPFFKDGLSRIITTNKEVKYLRTRIQRITDANDKTTGIVGLSWDVTADALLKLEKDQTDSQFQLMISLIESSTDLFGFSDESGVPLYVNQAGHDVYGVSIGQRQFMDYIATKDRKYALEVVVPSIKEKKGWEGEILVLNPITREEIPVWLRIFSVKVGPEIKDIFFACSASDLRKMKAIQSSLMMQSKMAALGEMAAEMAHEINNPLMIIQVKAQMLYERLLQSNVDPAKVITDLQLIEKNSHRIQKIVHSSKAISRNAEMDPYTHVAILTLVDETFEIFHERFSKRKLKLELNVEDGINYNDTIEARGSEILQVLVNLLNNAYDAIRHQPDGWVKFKVSKAPGNFYEIQVTDSGGKIPKHIADKMMEPFFTTKPTGQGTGLGLSISKQIIENHKGQFFYDATAPNTKFVVSLQKRIS